MLNVLLLPICLSAAHQWDRSATLQLDASEAPMHVLHTVETLPVRSGPLTLCYAKWIPGEHMPSGPILNLVNLHIFSGNRELPWRRDLVESHNFRLEVPAGSDQLTIKLDYVTPTTGGAYGSAPSTNADLGVINWYENAIWPQGVTPDQIKVVPSLRLPLGWKSGGSLDVDVTDGDTVRYTATSVAQLNDHPVVIGRHYRRIDLFPQGSDVGEHAIDVIADSDWALAIPPSRIENYRRLVREERAVFGGVGHYRKYHWLLTLSDSLGWFGVEHHECADDRAPENLLVDDDASRLSADLLPHEFFHSWNGKTLRPSGLINGGYENPMRDDGLWVYEGMTNYYGDLLAARSGLMSPADYAETLASAYAKVNNPGRSWRTLQDTADAAPDLYGAGSEWSGIRRSTDFYEEGSLIWLEADARIRSLTQGARSLDDFCASFEGGANPNRPYVRSYETSEIYEALNRIAPNDWRDFFETKLNSKGETPPQGGFTAAGYRLVYSDTPNFYCVKKGQADSLFSLGLAASDSGDVQDSWPGYPGYLSGISAGAKIIAVNGKQFSNDEFKRAIVGAERSRGPLQFIVKNGGEYKVVSIDYHNGLRFPHLERIPGSRDLLADMISPRTHN